MKTLFRLLVILPLAVLLLVFALANRHSVNLSFDPFIGTEFHLPDLYLPLFIPLLAAGMVGVITGGIVTWFTQGRHRKAARAAKAQVADLQDEAKKLRALVSQNNAQAEAKALVPRDAA